MVGTGLGVHMDNEEIQFAFAQMLCVHPGNQAARAWQAWYRHLEHLMSSYKRFSSMLWPDNGTCNYSCQPAISPVTAFCSLQSCLSPAATKSPSGVWSWLWAHYITTLKAALRHTDVHVTLPLRGSETTRGCLHTGSVLCPCHCTGDSESGGLCEEMGIWRWESAFIILSWWN